MFVGTNTVVLCDIDVLNMFGAHGESLDSSYHKIGKQFRVKNPAKPKNFLGLDLTWNDNDSVSLDQEQLINKLLEDTGMEQSKPVGNPIKVNTLEDEAESNSLSIDEHAMYRRNLGSLMYIAMQTGPNLVVAISMLSSHLH